MRVSGEVAVCEFNNGRDDPWRNALHVSNSGRREDDLKTHRATDLETLNRCRTSSSLRPLPAATSSRA
jgi:hypothetical protein